MSGPLPAHAEGGQSSSGGETERHERVEALVAAMVEPARAGDGVLGQRQGVEAGRFSRTGHVGEGSGVEHVALGAAGLG
jgi:hypothetical protein